MAADSHERPAASTRPGAQTGHPEDAFLPRLWHKAAMTKAKAAARKSIHGLTQLGQATRQPASPDAAVLETAPNPQPGGLYLVRFTQPEFTRQIGRETCRERVGQYV